MRTIWSLWQDAIGQARPRPAYLVEEQDGWREVSWAEAAEAVEELANGLLALGIGKGDAFGILAYTRLEWSLFDFALAQIGAVAAPIYPSSTPAESRYILEHSNAVGCLVESEADLAKIADPSTSIRSRRSTSCGHSGGSMLPATPVLSIEHVPRSATTTSSHSSTHRARPAHRRPA